MKINLTLVFAGLFFIVSSTLHAQIITTIAGNGTTGYNGDSIPAKSAELAYPYGVAIDAAGNIYIADEGNNVIQRIDALTGIIKIVAGTTQNGYNGDDIIATEAEINLPTGVAIDSSGNVYIADYDNNRIRKVDAITGIISTVVGIGYGGYRGDGGPAVDAEVYSPTSIAIDGKGNLYIADEDNNRIRKVDATTGIITTVAGKGTQGYNGDSILATAAELYFPFGVAVDAGGNLYISDTYNARVRKVDATSGIITTVAGKDTSGYNGDGIAAATAELGFPEGITIDRNGNLYIADEGESRIRRVDAISGIISTVAGDGINAYTGDGIPATAAGLADPTDVVIDSSGNMYIADMYDGRIRRAPIPSTNFYVTLVSNNANCNSSGTITSSLYGGVPPYRYLWNNGDSSANLNAAPAGSYYVTVTDSNGRQTTGYAKIQNTCNSIIRGMIFNDANGDCVFDNGDQPLINRVIEIVANGGYYYGNSDSNGFYMVEVPDSGTMYVFSLNYFDPSCVQPTTCNKTTDTIFIANMGDSVSNINFAISSSAEFDLTLHPGWISASPGFAKQYWVMPYNLLNVSAPAEVTVIFNYDSNLIYQSSLPPLPAVDTVNHTLTWVISGPSIPSGTWNWNNERFVSNFIIPYSLNPNYQLQSSFEILPTTGDCDTANNYLSFSDVVTGSHDPNVKEVSPAGEITDADSVLTYTIYFQNTGSASTNFITVIDTLSPNLEPASVVNLASSNNYSSFNISGTGILTWMFNPLNLPPRSVDSVASKGFIMFSVRTKPNLAFGSGISNSATIYFDYNPGIQTNTVTDTVAAITGISTVKAKNVSVTTFPNPFNEQTHIIINGISQKYDFGLFDLTGRLQIDFPNLRVNEFNLSRGDLPAGVYLYRVVTGGEPAGYGKLVIE